MSTSKRPPSQPKEAPKTGGPDIQSTVSIQGTPWTNDRPGATGPVERLGDLLRREREKRGDNIQRVADTLCIKSSLLVALESNQYDLFPADAYVIGFLRSYATYLGIDGREAIDRYRHEMVGRRKKPSLVMPTPVIEGRAPSALVLGGAILATILIYAVWYGVSSPDPSSEIHPPTLPQNHAAEGPAKSENPAAVTATHTALQAPQPSPINLVTPNQKVVQGAQASLPPPSPQPSSNSDAEPMNTKSGILIPVEPSQITDAQPFAPKSNININQAPASPQDNNTSLSPYPSRISIRADQASWILIMDNRGHTIIDRVLSAGEVYKVPTTKGLTLTIGNNSDIKLSVDGQELPEITSHKDNAKVMRDIPLDPKRLKALSAKSAD